MDQGWTDVLLRYADKLKPSAVSFYPQATDGEDKKERGCKSWLSESPERHVFLVNG